MNLLKHALINGSYDASPRKVQNNKRRATTLQKQRAMLYPSLARELKKAKQSLLLEQGRKKKKFTCMLDIQKKMQKKSEDDLRDLRVHRDKAYEAEAYAKNKVSSLVCSLAEERQETKTAKLNLERTYKE